MDQKPRQAISGLRDRMREYLAMESAGGLMLMAAALLAMLLVNLGGAGLYETLRRAPLVVSVSGLGVDKPLLLWVNDGLMAVFFFLVGLEVKRELLAGELSSWAKAGLPLVAAVGGMAAPAGVFVLINRDAPEHLAGWAIPAATDIAFALGILGLLGGRAPNALRILLLAIAIIDDIGAIAIIALFYSAELSFTALAGAGLVTVVLFVLNRAGVTRPAAYILLGIVMWLFVLKSGVHATLAGVAAALFVPLAAGNGGESPLERLEHALHPWVAYLILPLFAFANAGLTLSGLGFGDLLAPLPLGIALGLFLGKQFGVFGAIALARWLRPALLPQGASLLQLYGMACLAGVGFTMSLFIGSLAFHGPELESAVKIGVLAGSLASGVLGYCVLRFARPPRAESG